MAELDAHIRPLKVSDDKLVRFTIGKAAMESLAIANRRDDRLNRPEFEKLVQDVLRGPDMSDMVAYYSRSPASGFYLCEYGGLFVGLVGLDAAPQPSSTAPITTDVKNSSKPAASSIAIIRHIYVDEAYRSTGIQEDLLAHALRVAFGAEPALQVVEAPESPLLPYVSNCLEDASFGRQENTQKIGVFGWQLGVRSLKRADWEKKHE
ncbi:hypothetical protein H0H81_002444 [Sphagnurus paluster]|uniref:N-acetyltransferase domain-containing protein n=1 Tax=Sphagnurus paluster TaxID=117069 RepID=A0A9P7GLV6_9AGAR|nr:hypothetical protein H0H81_002444 [Sphagnurus paluster]